MEFSIWLNKHRGSQDINLSSKETHRNTTGVYCLMHPVWKGSCKLLTWIFSFGASQSAVLPRLSEARREPAPTRLVSWAKFGPFNELCSGHPVKPILILKAGGTLTFCFVLYCWYLVYYILSSLIRKRVLVVINGGQRDVGWQEIIGLFSFLQESLESIWFWLLKSVMFLFCCLLLPSKC